MNETTTTTTTTTTDLVGEDTRVTYHGTRGRFHGQTFVVTHTIPGRAVTGYWADADEDTYELTSPTSGVTLTGVRRQSFTPVEG